MSEEILINVTPQETRVAVVENGVLQEVHIERSRARGIVGNIYRGRVERILPGMQAAFVDIGLEKAAFLQMTEARPLAANGLRPDGPLREGESVIVQVVKDPLGSKGARLTTHITLPARYLVYLPFDHHIGVSQKIGDDAERDRLKRVLKSLIGEGDGGGYILRTVAEKVSEDELRNDIMYLQKLWSVVKQRIDDASPKSLLHEDLSLALRALRDLIRGQVEKVRIDSREGFARAREFVREFVPEAESRVEYYPGERPIFDLYSAEDEIGKALDRRVPLKSGGYIIIDQTEAMTTIDVNTGTYVGRKNLEETLFKTNLEAAQAIARQLRLRNLGGMIIIDFIDMTDPDHRRQVLRSLEKALARDRSRVSMTEMSSLGLVEITRKRTRESLEHVLCEACPTCKGRGTIKSAETICYDIFREILREARQFGTDQYLVLASQTVIDRLLDEEAASVLKLQEFIGKTIQLQAEARYNQDEFDVILM
ncbi:MAG: ribonuclease G [Acidiferrobacteraceae bacterium]